MFLLNYFYFLLASFKLLLFLFSLCLSLQTSFELILDNFENALIRFKVPFILQHTYFTWWWNVSIIDMSRLVSNNPVNLVSRIDWCEGHWNVSTYMVVRLSDISSKTDKKCVFCVFMLFLSLCRTASQPYKLRHFNALRINQFY